MKVVRHERIGVNGDGVADRLTMEQPEEELEVRRAAEHIAAVVAALHDVLCQSRQANAGAARHTPRRRKSRSQ